jgi:hypothetical protein
MSRRIGRSHLADERAERRLSGVVRVYAAPDQGICGVDM